MGVPTIGNPRKTRAGSCGATSAPTKEMSVIPQGDVANPGLPPLPNPGTWEPLVENVTVDIRTFEFQPEPSNFKPPASVIGRKELSDRSASRKDWPDDVERVQTMGRLLEV